MTAALSPATAAAQCSSCVNAVSLPSTVTYSSLVQTGNASTVASTPGDAGFFTINLSGVPANYSIANQPYAAWCGDWYNATALSSLRPGTNFPLYSTYSPSLPSAYAPQNGDFTEINYILNHKAGTVQDVQDAIWLVMTGQTGDTPTATGQALFAAAVANKGYVPPAGGILAALVAINPVAQNTTQNLLFEVTVPTLGSIGDFIFSDLNRNGVQDAGEPGINGVTVNLLSNGSVVQSTTSLTFMGNAGYYQFTNLAAGTYTVQVVTSSAPLTGMTPSPTGAGTPATDSNPNPSTVTLTATYNSSSVFTGVSSDETIDFGFYTPCTGSIGSVVFSDTNANGIQDAGETGLSGIMVSVSGPGGFSASTTTNGTGNYSFSGLCSGAYTVSVGTGLPTGSIESPVVAAGNLPTNVGTNNSATVTLTTNSSSNPTIDFGYHAPCAGAIGNTVFNDVNGNGTQDAGEPGINGVTLSLYNMATGVTSTTTTMQIAGVNGSYQFSGLCPAQYTVTVGSGVPTGLTPSPVVTNTNTAVNANTGSPATVTLGAGMTNPNVDFGFAPPCNAQIGDLVFNDINGNGVQDAGEPGIAGVTVNLLNASTNAILQTTTTVSGGMALGTGNYIFKGLCVGSYIVKVTPPTGYTATQTGAGTPATDSNPNPSAPIVISETVNGGTATLNSDLTIDFGFYQLSLISGNVYTDVNRDKVDNTGDTPLSGVTVTLKGTDVTGKAISLTTTSASNGTYSFPNLFAGNYTVSVSTSPVGTETLETSSSISVTLAANVPSTNNNFGYVTPVAAPLMLTCATGSAQVGSIYSSGVSVTGGVSPYTFSIASGALPNGLSLNASTGAITGTPTAAGSFAYSVKVVDAAGTVAYSTCTSGCSGGSTSSFNLLTTLGNLGNSYSWTSNGVALTAYGFNNNGTATALYAKNQGSTENGIGIASDSDFEINTSTFIQLDVNALKAAGVTNPQISFNSVQSGENYNIYGSNTLGSIGTLLSGPLTTANTLFALPGYGTYRYIGLRAGAANVLFGGLAATFPSTCSITVAAAPVPKLIMTKTASATKVNPFQPVTYTYKVTNAGTATVTNIVVTDDNATPGYTADDVTVGSIASLAPGASATLTATLIPPVTEGANTITQTWAWNNWNKGFDYNNVTPGGTLICKQLTNGHVQMTWRQDPSMNDNTFGSNSSSDWGQSGHNFNDMLGSNSTRFQFMDKNGATQLDMQTDYISQSSGKPSGYGTQGLNAQNCGIYSGDSKKVINIDTSLSHCLNQSPSFYSCTKNSPSAGTPGWDSIVGYTVEVDGAAFGSSGFGGVAIPLCISSPTKSGNTGWGWGWGSSSGSLNWVKPISSSATNTATATSTWNGQTISATATATVAIDATPQGWSQCGKY